MLYERSRLRAAVGGGRLGAVAESPGVGSRNVCGYRGVLMVMGGILAATAWLPAALAAAEPAPA